MQGNNNFTKPATPEIVDAITKIAPKKLGIERIDAADITGYTPAQIMETLFVKVLDGAVVPTKTKYFMTQLFGVEMLRLGNQEYKYFTLPATSGDSDIQEDNSIADFNGEYVPEYAELVELDQKFSKKIKIPDMLLSDAWLAAGNMVEFVQIQVQEMDRAQIKDMENYTWTLTLEEKVDKAVEGTEMKDILKEITKDIRIFNTTSKEHFAVGTGGVEVLKTVAGDKDYQPENRFEGGEFMMFLNTSDTIDYEWDTLANVFNIKKQDVEPNQIIDFEFDNYSGFDAILKEDGTTEKRAAVVLPTGVKAILIHKSWLKLFDKFNYTSQVRGKGPWTINYNNKEFGSYRVKGIPKPIFYSLQAPAKK